jgi:hypothetical protein
MVEWRWGDICIFAGECTSDDQQHHEHSRHMSNKASNHPGREMLPPDDDLVLEIRDRRSERGHKIEITPDAYVSYFENDTGEQLIFVRQRGDAHATLYHSGCDWTPVRLAPDDPTDLPDIVLKGADARWLELCWAASAPRPDRRRLKTAPIWAIDYAFRQQFRTLVSQFVTDAAWVDALEARAVEGLDRSIGVALAADDHAMMDGFSDGLDGRPDRADEQAPSRFRATYATGYRLGRQHRQAGADVSRFATSGRSSTRRTYLCE